MVKKKNNKTNTFMYVIIVLSIILLYKRLKRNTSSTIPIPRYTNYKDLNGVFSNIPADLKIIIEYFGSDPNYQNYKVCLVGEKESVSKDLKDKNYQGDYPFIHLDNNSLRSLNLPSNVIESIEEVNALVSNPENDFNDTDLGIHTVGLVPTAEITTLKNLGYGISSWNTIGVFANNSGYCCNCTSKRCWCCDKGVSCC